jgi:predicted transcriptional regulator
MGRVSNNSISELTLEEIFSDRLTNTPCVYLNNKREVWVAIEMCVQYLETTIDSIVIRDENHNPLGIVGGYDLLNHIRKHPTRDFQYENKVGEIMFRDLPIVGKETKLKDLIEKWKNSRRAFAIIPNDFKGYSPISARKMLEVGMKCNTDISVSSMPKKKIITFSPDDSLGKVIDLMFEHKTRKILLEYSNQFISDRLILEEISRILKFQPDIDNFLDIPVNQIELGEVKIIKDDLNLSHICSMMYKMDHPYVYYKDIAISPWDVCLTLLSEDLTAPLEMGFQKKISCPHCGKTIS